MSGPMVVGREGMSGGGTIGGGDDREECGDPGGEGEPEDARHAQNSLTRSGFPDEALEGEDQKEESPDAVADSADSEDYVCPP
jgi:hypothetical protein